MLRRFFHLFAGLAGLYGVTAGALAAHAIANARAADMVETAALYALLHAAVLLGWKADGRIADAARLFFCLGLALFCGAITARYGLDLTLAGKVAPAGGIALIAGWALVCLRAAAKGS